MGTLSDTWQEVNLRYGQHIPPLSFFGGFIYDTYALTRIDLLLDNILLLAYLLIASIAIVIIGRVDRGHTERRLFVEYHDWYVIILHFCMGGLFSAYTILYFRSAAVGQSYIFVGLLLLVLILNEFVRHRLSKLKLLGVMHFFCSFAFFTFFIPVMTSSMDFTTFLAGGFISLLFTSLIWICIYTGRLQELWQARISVLGPPVGILMAMTLLYTLNWIPPVPLSVKEIGIYRNVIKHDGGRYEVHYRKPLNWEIARRDERDFEYTPGDTIYCFASVFAPTEMKERIIHHWQWKDKNGEWTTTDKIGYNIVGGRDGGWRGHTHKKNVGPGDWRIDVETEDGKIIGRIPLKILLAKRKPAEIKVEFK